jgi:hypothetical protein
MERGDVCVIAFTVKLNVSGRVKPNIELQMSLAKDLLRGSLGLHHSKTEEP